MPCYSIQLMTVEFKNKNIDLLKQALNKLEYKFIEYDSCLIFRDDYNKVYTINFNKGVVETKRGNTDIINKVKRMYSKQTLIKASKKNKWALRNINTNKYRAIKY